ncbi:winged helix-turn-helix transcriptional regulator [Nonomuraea jabiensis]|uniref:winged helix-turn-helix transcriptional regulator n=1 Tax=Nonomuraea jabiensis TaxID=882448 RepID=UPI003675BEF7
MYKRFAEGLASVEGITQRVLTQTLRRLERNGMIRRTVLPTSPGHLTATARCRRLARTVFSGSSWTTRR